MNFLANPIHTHRKYFRRKWKKQKHRLFNKLHLKSWSHLLLPLHISVSYPKHLSPPLLLPLVLCEAPVPPPQSWPPSPLEPRAAFPEHGKCHSSLQFSQFSSVQSFSCVWLFATPWSAAHQASLSITISWSLLKLMSIESVMPSNHLILCHPLLLLPSIFPSIRVFSSESVLCIRGQRWPLFRLPLWLL